MNTEKALAELGVTVNHLTATQRTQFDKDGFFVVENVFTPAEITEMCNEFDRLLGIEGEFGGRKVFSDYIIKDYSRDGYDKSVTSISKGVYLAWENDSIMQ
ncbi:hypothetical protein EBR37_03555, partial [bacterium]|nr:hypothetical protein [bacterium]